MRHVFLLALLLTACDGPTGADCTSDGVCLVTQVCRDGRCVTRPPRDGGPDAPSCGGSDTLCGGACVDLPSSEAHCGRCGNACGAMQECLDGMCLGECASTERRCDMTCVDTETDSAHCGDCGMPCEATDDCVAGACEIRCVPRDPSTERCDGVDSDCDGELDPVGCADELVGWYRFDGAGTAAVDTARGNDGAIEGMAALTSEGYVGGALGVDGAYASAVTVPDAAEHSFTNAFAAEAWIYVESCVNPGADHSTVAVIEGAFLFAFTPGCRISNYLFTDGRWRNDQPVASVPTGRWVHYAMSWDGATLVSYLDGDPVSAGTAFGGTMGDPAVALRIGSRLDCGCFQSFNGRIDELKIWRVHRTHPEICADAGGTFDAGRGSCSL